ncbi:MAG TPA: ribulokinase [Caproiciproducens sp.]|nr:ribulokinase [Caproiciproducens sp.]
MAKYVIGIDYGTLSARAILVDAANGSVKAVSSMDYPHGVMDKYLMDYQIPLEPDWALQYPMDYIDCTQKILSDIFRETGVDPSDVIGLGTDFTECTMLPTLADGTPLCTLEKFKRNPHAYVKLWKHHAAQDEANRLNETAAKRGEDFLQYYGGKISSEWIFPKIWQILNEAPEVYEAAGRFMELSDWITLMFTGEERRNSCTAGYKAIWQKKTGYPSNDFFKALDPKLEHVIDEKMSRTIYPVGTRAGCITEESAKWTGLRVGTPVAVGCGDAHAAVPGAGITGPDIMLMVIGTSGCDMMASRQEIKVPGMCGICEDGILPGYFGYEAGQSCMGDHFAWFTKYCTPVSLAEEAKQKGKHVTAYLDELAAKIRPGASGLLALDWWNGNRSVLVDVDLTGVMFGMTVTTTAPELYKALVEAVAYGKRMIVETFKNNGVTIEKLYATGGIAEKSPFVMQTFADVIKMPVSVTATQQATAMGAAMFGAVAAGSANGGYDTIREAGEAMGSGIKTVYQPNPENSAIYDRLYQEYVKLHDYFGRDKNSVMKKLKAIKNLSVK